MALPTEGDDLTSESNLYVFCGSGSRKKRKFESCHTYQASSFTKLLAALQIVIHKLKMNILRNLSINHLQCYQCHSRACVSFIESVCTAMRQNNNNINDQWYDSVQTAINNDDYPHNCIGHCCKIVNRVKECRNATKVLSVTDIPLGLRYDGFLHLPQLQY